jgi:hypothetical protein
LYYGLEASIWNADIVHSGVKQFEESFGAEDKEALAEALKQLTVNNKPAATWQDGYDATVVALKGTEAVMKKARVEIPKELFVI